MLICSLRSQSKFNVSHIQVGDREIHPVSVVRNIGAQLDETLGMRSHVNSFCSRAHFYLRNISKIRHLLDGRTTATLVRAYVTSRLDNGNVLLCGLLQTLQSKVQRVQSAAAWCVWLTDGSTSLQRTTLAACPSADFIQRASADIPSTVWDRTSVHGWFTFLVPANKIPTLQWRIASHYPTKSPPQQLRWQSVWACVP